MGFFARWRAARREQPMVRPWAIAGPVIVLLLAAPLLRPLFAPGMASDRERVTLEAVRSVLYRGTLELNPSRVRGAQSLYFAHNRVFATDAPVFPITLAGVSWLIERTGVRLADNAVLHEYMLILFAITLPTALACGMLYRIARVFELKRWWRATIALSCVIATGWFSYAVVLLPHALAAALVVMAVASAIHQVTARKPMLSVGWLAAGGFCAALAGMIEPSAIWALPLVPLMVLSLSHAWRVRLMGLLLVIAGAAAPIVLHVSVNQAITGNVLPPQFHDAASLNNAPPIVVPAVGDDVEPFDPSMWLTTGLAMNRLIIFTVGSHGIFSHFPVLLIGLAGAMIVLHRHWTPALKFLAGGAVLAIVSQLVLRMTLRLDASQFTFAAPSMVAAVPLLMLFSGAWLRRKHSSLTWTIIGIAAGVSVLITLIGATGPAPQTGFTGYSAVEAVERLFFPQRYSSVAEMAPRR